MTKSAPDSVIKFDTVRLQKMAAAARARGSADSEDLQPTPLESPRPETTGVLTDRYNPGGLSGQHMVVGNPDPKYVEELTDRITRVFGDDPEVMEKMGPQKARTAEAAGHVAIASKDVTPPQPHVGRVPVAVVNGQQPHGNRHASHQPRPGRGPTIKSHRDPDAWLANFLRRPANR